MHHFLTSHLIEKEIWSPGFQKPKTIHYLILSGSVEGGTLTLIVFPDQSQTPACVLRVLRDETQLPHFLNERDVLLHFQNLSPYLRNSVPKLLFCENIQGRWILGESVMKGAPLENINHLSLVTPWLIALANETKTNAASARGWQDVVERRIAEFQKYFTVSAAENDFFRKMLQAIQSREPTNPATFLVHGDFSRHNLFIAESGKEPSLQVIDWMSARRSPFPLHDCFLFLASYNMQTRKEPGLQGYLTVFSETFFASNDFSRLAKNILLDYCRGVGFDPGLLPFLFGFFLIEQAVLETERIQALAENGTIPRHGIYRGFSGDYEQALKDQIWIPFFHFFIENQSSFIGKPMIIQNGLSKSVMTELFERLKAEGVVYAILRNYDTLPDTLDPKGDLDLLISENNAASFQNILSQVVAEKGGQVLFTRRRFHCSSTFIFVPGGQGLATWIDAFTSIATRGVPWLKTSSILQERIEQPRGFFILSQGAEAATLLVKEVLGGRPVRTKYQEQIAALLQNAESAETFIRVLTPSFGEKVARQMLEFAKAKQWDQAFKKRRQWWWILLGSTLRKEPLRQIGRFFQFLWGHIAQGFLQSCPGGIVAVLGPDGVGKTTACRNLQARLKKWPFRKVLYYHGEFGVFPSLGKIHRFITKPWRFSETGTPQHQLPEAGPLRAFIHLIYYGLEFFLAWPWVLWGRWRGYCFIFDRFYYDFSLRSSHRWLYRLIIKIIPRPDLIILLSAPPLLVYERKQELTPIQIEKQLSTFETLHSGAIIIGTEQSSEAIISQMEEALVKSLWKQL